MRRLTASLLIVLVACGDDDGGDTDAGTDAGRDAARPDAGPRVTPPADCALPVLTPCPDGWREIDAGGIAACDPWPDSGREACAPGHAHFPGTPGCAPIGSPCPVGDFPDDLPATDVVHVRAGATAGTGARDAPFGTIAEGLAAVPPGGTIAIARGTYAESIAVRESAVHIRGACATETVLTGAPGSFLPLLMLIDVSDGSVRDLRLEAMNRVSAIVAVTRSNAVVSGLDLGGEASDGVSMLSGSLAAEELVVRGATGLALHIATDATATVRRAILTSSGPDWIAVGSFEARVDLEDVVVHHTVTRGGPDERLFLSSSGSTLRMTRAFVTGQGPLSALVYDEGSTVELVDAVLSGDAPAPRGTSGVYAFSGGRLVLRRARLERASAGTMIAGDPGSALVLEDTVIRDVHGTTEDDGYGRAVDIENGARADLTRVLIERANEIAILYTGAGATGTLSHVTVRDTRPDPAGFYGRALQAQLGAVVTGGPFRSSRQHEVAVLAASPGTRLSLTDTIIEETLPRGCEETTCPGFGAGIGAGSYLDGHLEIERFVVRDNTLAGIQVARMGQLDLCDGEIYGNPVGANVQVSDYDITRFSKQVWYHDNGQHLDATSLPVPDP